MCDNAPSYVLKLKEGKGPYEKPWEKKPEPYGRLRKGYMAEKKESATNMQTMLPRPTMESITKQNVPDLDFGNRFFDDNKYLSQKYGPGFMAVDKENEDI